MRKLLKQPWFVAVLAALAVVLCVLSLRDPSGGFGAGSRRAPANAELEPEATEIDAENAAVASENVSAPRSIAAILAALEFPPEIPDPFSRRHAQLVTSEPVVETVILPDERDTIELTAIWEQNGVRLALVNNQILRAGDRIGRLTIDEVTFDGIWVSHWKGRDFVPFGSDFTLLTPASAPAAPASDPSPSLALHES